MAVYTDIGRIIRMSHGKCILESDYTWNQCVGCNGVADSETGVSGSEMISLSLGVTVMDLQNWTSVQCLETSSVDWDKCIGCDGIPFSNKSFNECGRCLLETDPEFDNCCDECRNVCHGCVWEVFELWRK